MQHRGFGQGFANWSEDDVEVNLNYVRGLSPIEKARLVQLTRAEFHDNHEVLNVFLPFKKAFGNFSDKLKIRFEKLKGLSKKQKNELCSMRKEAFQNLHMQWGHGWEDSAENDHLLDKSHRYLLMEEFENPDDPGKIIAFTSFSFTLQGTNNGRHNGETCLFLEIFVKKPYRRKGIAKRLFQILELIARKYHIFSMMTKVVNGSKEALDFMGSVGLKLDNYIEDDQPLLQVDGTFNYYQKKLRKSTSSIEPGSNAQGLLNNSSGGEQSHMDSLAVRLAKLTVDGTGKKKNDEKKEQID